ITIGQALKIARDHYNAGQLPQAEEVCRKLLVQKPDQADALCMLGFLIAARNRDEGVAMIRRAIEINPDNAEFHYNLGCALFAGKLFDEAIAAWEQATALRPDRPEAWCSLGSALADRGRPQEAAAAFTQAIAVRPRYAE